MGGGPFVGLLRIQQPRQDHFPLFAASRQIGEGKGVLGRPVFSPEALGPFFQASHPVQHVIQGIFAVGDDNAHGGRRLGIQPLP